MTKCHICGTKIICNSKDGCRESPTRHSHYDVRWGDIKSYGGWASITICTGHTSQEVSQWLQRKVDTLDLPSDQEKANQKEAEEIMASMRRDFESINQILSDKNFVKWFRKLSVTNEEKESQNGASI